MKFLTFAAKLLFWTVATIPLAALSIGIQCTTKIGKSRNLVGEIANKPYWLNVQKEPINWDVWEIRLGPTYNGTTHGFTILFPGIFIIGHKRNLNKV